MSRRCGLAGRRARQRRAEEGARIQQFFRPFPKYLQIRDALLGRLERDYQPGERFPTEQALCAEFGVSRETVREALRALEADGLISRHAGRGTFVSGRPKPQRERRLTGPVEDFTDLKLDTEARVLEAANVEAPGDVAEVLDCAVVFRMLRLRCFEGAPLALHEAFLPVPVGERLATLDLEHTALINELGGTLGIAWYEAWQRVEALCADTDVAGLLDVRLGAPLLYITRLVRQTDERPLVLFRSHFRADRYFYTVETQGKRRPRAR